MIAFHESLWIAEETQGPECLEVTNTLEKIGSIHLFQGETEEGMAAFDEVINVTHIVLGADHPNVAPSLRNIGRVHQQRGDLKKAWELYLVALDIYKSCNFKMDHIDMKTTRRSIATDAKLIQSK
eukprot:2670742-Ditylum_brightwellii.AAC.1